MIIDQLITVIKSVIDNVLNAGGLSDDSKGKRFITKRSLCKVAVWG